MRPKFWLSKNGKRLSAWLRFGMALGLVIVLWGYVLPRIARHPDFVARREQMQRAGIDPSAFFYTDHPRIWDGWSDGQSRQGPGHTSTRNQGQVHAP